MLKLFKWSFLVVLVVTSVQTFSHDPERASGGLPRVGVGVHAPRLEGRLERSEARLPLPSPQELEAIRKVAQVLAMLGEQIIPAIIGESPGKTTATPPDVPNDPVNIN